MRAEACGEGVLGDQQSLADVISEHADKPEVWAPYRMHANALPGQS